MLLKILLISTNTETDPYPVYPIGLDYVARAIGDRHQVLVIDMNLISDDAALVTILLHEKPDLVGLSIRNIDTNDSTNVRAFSKSIGELIRLIRNHTQARIILGGSGFTIMPEAWMHCLDADFGVIGEGERLPLLLTALEKKEDPARLPGIVRQGDPVVFPEPWSGSFHRGPLPNRDNTSFYLQRGGMLNLQTKRGCPFRCIYCTYPHIEGKTFRPVPPDEVAATARMLQDAGARYLYITDSTFNGDYDQSLAVASAFQKAGVSVPWGAFFTPTNPPRHYYALLAQAGLRHVEFGTESLSDIMLAAYKKPFRMKNVREAHHRAEEAGLNIAHYFMLGGPGESESTLRETLDKTSDLGRAVYFVFNGIRLYPHTQLYDIALREGQISPATDMLKPIFYWSPGLDEEKAREILAGHTEGKANWLVGSGAEKTARILARMYARGRVGPLWEYLIR